MIILIILIILVFSVIANIVLILSVLGLKKELRLYKTWAEFPDWDDIWNQDDELEDICKQIEVEKSEIVDEEPIRGRIFEEQQPDFIDIQTLHSEDSLEKIAEQIEKENQNV